MINSWLLTRPKTLIHGNAKGHLVQGILEIKGVASKQLLEEFNNDLSRDFQRIFFKQVFWYQLCLYLF
jgi:membrane protein required for beta-lactamase induction